MAQRSLIEIRIPSLHQIGIVVKDVQKTAENYWKMLGIGPWLIITSQSYDQTYHGKSTHFKSKIAFAQVGPVELELMETLEGPTTFSDFMAEHGEGPHHLQYLVDNVAVIDKHARIMTQNGFPSLMSGRFGDDCGFDFFDTVSALKIIWEAVKESYESAGTSVTYPANKAETSPAKVKVKAITQLGLVVKDVQKTTEDYWKLLGIGPWDIYELAPPFLHTPMYKGKSSNFTVKIASTSTGNAQMKLVEPLSGDNIYNDFLLKYGEGLHHIQFVVDNIDETTQLMNEVGFPALMSLSLGDGAAAYYDTIEPLKCIWEAFQPPKTMPSVARLDISR